MTSNPHNTLLESLRAVHTIRRDQTPLDVVVSLCSAAADEIERLTAELAVLNKLYEESCNNSYEYGAMREERDRLRAALEDLASRKQDDCWNGPDCAACRMADDARKVLAGAGATS